ncbi:MAG: hypothetical protein S4CHLAM81_14080 [Chlamydiales bacterium]|nr:hypothetical protein [Chlamydiales bacterium]MCH9636180.1 hypothetical protein [Chlamydiales bacterium]MCH9704230.1 hypothetical protein [Chlamydiota bacterium]
MSMLIQFQLPGGKITVPSDVYKTHEIVGSRAIDLYVYRYVIGRLSSMQDVAYKSYLEAAKDDKLTEKQYHFLTAGLLQMGSIPLVSEVTHIVKSVKKGSPDLPA